MLCPAQLCHVQHKLLGAQQQVCTDPVLSCLVLSVACIQRDGDMTQHTGPHA